MCSHCLVAKIGIMVGNTSIDKHKELYYYKNLKMPAMLAKSLQNSTGIHLNQVGSMRYVELTIQIFLVKVSSLFPVRKPFFWLDKVGYSNKSLTFLAGWLETLCSDPSDLKTPRVF